MQIENELWAIRMNWIIIFKVSNRFRSDFANFNWEHDGKSLILLQSTLQESKDVSKILDSKTLFGF